jgi:hypothetical protein
MTKGIPMTTTTTTGMIIFLTTLIPTMTGITMITTTTIPTSITMAMTSIMAGARPASTWRA